MAADDAIALRSWKSQQTDYYLAFVGLDSKAKIPI